MFEEVSEKDRTRVGADGIISKPLREGEVLSLTDQLMEGAMDEKSEKETMNEEERWTFLPEKGTPRREGKEDFVLDEAGEDNEEIIELVEVVEEPEPKMSIDNFVSTGKAEPTGEIPPLDSWEKVFGGEEAQKTAEKFEDRPEGKPVEKPSEETLEFILEEEKETGPGVDLKAQRETSPDEELFEKIELEEILEKVERLQPAIEKEWPRDQEIEKRINEALPTPEEDKKWLDLQDFESALKSEVKEEEKTASAEPAREELQPFILDEPFTLAEMKEDAPANAVPPTVEIAVEEEVIGDLDEEGLPVEFVEEEVGEDEISAIGESLKGKEDIEFLKELELPGLVPEVQPETLSEEAEIRSFIQEIQVASSGREAEPLGLVEEVKHPAPRREVGVEGLIQEIPLVGAEKELEPLTLVEELEPAVPREEAEVESLIQGISVAGPPEDVEPLILGEELEPPAPRREAGVASLIQEVPLPGPVEEVAPASLVQGIQTTVPRTEAESFVQEIPIGVPLAVPEAPSPAQEVQPPPPKEAGAPRPLSEKVHPQAEGFERRMEEVIGKGVQEMMEGFITKVLPEMTQNIVNLTMERIETVVKEVIPDLAEKAIQEEIKRLQKGDKD